jgi:hypothetical protein
MPNNVQTMRKRNWDYCLQLIWFYENRYFRNNIRKEFQQKQENVKMKRTLGKYSC